MWLAMMGALGLGQAEAEPVDGVPEPFAPQGFTAQVRVEIDAPREAVFAAATGDVSGWWDHTFSGGPAELAIEPEFGGRFYERFENGAEDGVLHAMVIYVDAPRSLRLDGPLGLSGKAVHKVATRTLEEADGGTVFTVDLAMSGQIDAPTAGIVTDVWRHFIGARLKPYVEAGCHERPGEPCAAFDE